MSIAPKALTRLQYLLDGLEIQERPITASELAGATGYPVLECQLALDRFFEDGLIDYKSRWLRKRVYWITVEGRIWNERTMGCYDPSRGNEYEDPLESITKDFWKPKVPGRNRKSKPQPQDRRFIRTLTRFPISMAKKITKSSWGEFMVQLIVTVLGGLVLAWVMFKIGWAVMPQ